MFCSVESLTAFALNDANPNLWLSVLAVAGSGGQI